MTAAPVDGPARAITPTEVPSESSEGPSDALSAIAAYEVDVTSSEMPVPAFQVDVTSSEMPVPASEVDVTSSEMPVPAFETYDAAPESLIAPRDVPAEPFALATSVEVPAAPPEVHVEAPPLAAEVHIEQRKARAPRRKAHVELHAAPPAADAPLPAPPAPPPVIPVAPAVPAAPPAIRIDTGSMLRRRWPLVLAATVTITLLALMAAAMQPKRYRASSIGAVTPISDKLSTSDILRGVDSLDRRVVVASLAALASAPVTHRAAQAKSGETIVASVLPNTNLFRIEVEAGDAARAMQVANRVPTVLNAQANRMYRMYGVTLISEAAAPDSPATPRMGRAVATGLVLGLLAGLASAWLFDRRRATP